MTKSQILNFKEGETITWQKGDLHLTNKIGEGLTSVVFRAKLDQEPVVVKTLKESSSDVVKDFFMQEAKNIISFSNKWKEYFPDIDPVTPKYHGGDGNTVPPFLVMALISGEQIPNLIGRDGALDEKTALALAVQMGKMFKVLHEGLNQTYSDIKFDNFWIIPGEGEAGPTMKVTDWNVLLDKNDENIRRDLFYASVYLYTMLTGFTPEFSLGKLRDPLEKAELFNNLTKGTQTFLRRSLHNNFDRRYATASAWYEALYDLDQVWIETPSTLNLNASKSLNDGEIAKKDKDLQRAGEEYRRAQLYLEVSESKGKGNEEIWDRLFSKMEEGFESANYQEQGYRFLSGMNFTKAMEAFDEGADISPEGGELLRRWYWVAHSAHQVGQDDYRIIQDRVYTGMDAFVQGEWEKAENLFEDVVLEFRENPPLGLQSLWIESKIYYLDIQAKKAHSEERYDDAVTLYREARELGRKLPKEPATDWAEEIGDINTVVQRYSEYARSIGEAKEQISYAEMAVADFDWDKAAKHFRNASLAAPDERFPFKAWMKAAKEQFAQGDLEKGMALLEGSLGLAGAKNNVAVLYGIGYSLNVMVDEARKGNFDLVLEKIISYRSKYLNNDLAMGEIFTKTLDTVMVLAEDRNQISLAEQIIEIAKKVNPDLADHYKTKLIDLATTHHDRQQHIIDEELAKAVQISSSHKIEDIKEAQEIVNQLKNIVHPEHWREADVLKQDEILNEKYQMLITARKAKMDAQIQKLTSVKAAIEEAQRSVEGKEVKRKELTQLAGEHEAELIEIIRSISHDLTLILKSAYEWLSLVPGAEEPREIIDSIETKLNEYGEFGWREVFNLADQSLSLLEKKYQDINRFIESGDLDKAQSQLSYLAHVSDDSTQYAALLGDLETTRDFLDWGTQVTVSIESEAGGKDAISVSRFVETLKSYKSHNILPVYWQKSDLLSLIKEKTGLVYQRLSALPNTGVGRFLPLARDYILMRRAEILVKQGLDQEMNTLSTRNILHDIMKSMRKYIQQKKKESRKKPPKFVDLCQELSPALELNALDSINYQRVQVEKRNQKIKQTALLAAGFVALIAIAAGVYLKWDAIKGVLGIEDSIISTDFPDDSMTGLEDDAVMGERAILTNIVTSLEGIWVQKTHLDDLDGVEPGFMDELILSSRGISINGDLVCPYPSYHRLVFEEYDGLDERYGIYAPRYLQAEDGKYSFFTAQCGADDQTFYFYQKDDHSLSVAHNNQESIYYSLNEDRSFFGYWISVNSQSQTENGSVLMKDALYLGHSKFSLGNLFTCSAPEYDIELIPVGEGFELGQEIYVPDNPLHDQGSYQLMTASCTDQSRELKMYFSGDRRLWVHLQDTWWIFRSPDRISGLDYEVTEDVVQASANLEGNFTTYYVVDNEDAVLSPSAEGLLKTFQGDGYAGSMYYLDEDVPKSSPLWINWIFGTKAAPGYYELFYLDPNHKSHTNRNNTTLNYEVYLDGMQLKPLAGTGEAAQWVDSVEEENWQSLGIYHLPQGGNPVVKLDLSSVSGHEGREVGLDAILLAKVLEPDPEQAVFLTYPDFKEGHLLFWIDDLEFTTRIPETGWEVLPNDAENWYGASSVSSDLVAPQIVLELDRKLPAGTYDVYALIPPTAESKVEYSILVDGKSISSYTLDPVVEGKQGHPQPLTTFTIGPEDYDGSVISVVVKKIDVDETLMAVDAILLLLQDNGELE